MTQELLPIIWPVLTAGLGAYLGAYLKSKAERRANRDNRRHPRSTAHAPAPTEELESRFSGNFQMALKR